MKTASAHLADLETPPRSITTLLDRVNGGEAGAFGHLVNLVYDDLRRVAAGRMRKEFDGPLAALTERPTAIVHEALIKLREQRIQWQGREHFFAIATRLLGYVIADYKKRRVAQKRGGRAGRGKERDASLEARPDPEAGKAPEALETISILEALHERHPRKAEVVTLRVLAGRSMPEVAQMIGISLPTAERDWKFAKAWIRDYLKTGNGSL
jgi:RNA polymerase sigma factor (TIGR02999 family)